jgi:Protein of unknown function (DUF2281)
MSTAALYSKFDLLPEHLKQQVLDYVEFLLSREGVSKTLPAVTLKSKDKPDTVKPSPEDADIEPLFAQMLHPLLSQNPSFYFLTAEDEDIYSDADLKIKY